MYREAKGKHSVPPVSLRAQLLWRDFYYVVGCHTPHFDRMEGNPVCKQIPWVLDEDRLEAWKESRTGYPWIDAIMAQLKEQGWMHHLARHSVACFLTRGDLCAWRAPKPAPGSRGPRTARSATRPRASSLRVAHSPVICPSRAPAPPDPSP